MNPDFSEFMERTCLELARKVPELPTQMGMFEISGQEVPQDYFHGIDAGSVADRQAFLLSVESGLARFSRSELDESEQTSADVLSFLVQYFHERGLIGIRGKDFLRHEYQLRPSVGLQSDLPLFLTDLHPMRHSADAEDYLARLAAISDQLAEADYQQQERPRSSLLQPGPVITDTIAEIERFIATPAEQNVLYIGLAEKTRNLPGLDELSRASLLREALTELQNRTYPAYLQLLDTLRQQAAFAADPPGVWQFPDGEDWYGFMLRAATTTSLTAAEIHGIGLEEVVSVQRAILETSRELGIAAGSLAECLRAFDKDKPPPLPDTEESRSTISALMQHMITEAELAIRPLFHQLPRGSITVKTIPRFAEANRNQSYQPPSLDGTRAGFLELNAGQLLTEADYELSILAYHEIFPGHHLQIALAQETSNLPSLRRILTLDAYIEGWAKYAETIPERHNINTNLRFRLSRLRRELFSTINLVLDTGIHFKRWSTEQAIQYFSENAGVSHDFSRFIAHRSAAVPAQLCSYKLGMMKMQELRNRMESALGEQFDVRDFHHAVLSRGAMPLELLERLVNQDITRKCA